MSTFPVVPYEKQKHESAYLRFLEKVLGAEKFATRRKAVAWLHDGHPLRGERPPLRFVVTDDEKIAGSMGHMPADYMIKGERVAVRITHDLLVDPEYRGQGLAKKIVDNSKATGDFYPGGMWMNVPCYKIHRACGFDDVLSPTTQTLVLDPGAFARRQGFNAVKRVAVAGALGVTRARAMRKARAVVDSETGGVACREVGEFDPRLDGAWLSMVKSYDIAACREAAFLNWKYTKHPVLKYRFTVAERGGDTRGYLVWRMPLEGGKENRAVIVDYLVERGDVETLKAMTAKVIVEAETGGAEALSVMTTHPRAVKLLRTFGFLPRRGSHSWVIANWERYLPREWLVSHEPWHVCLGDSDGDFWTGGQ